MHRGYFCGVPWGSARLCRESDGVVVMRQIMFRLACSAAELGGVILAICAGYKGDWPQGCFWLLIVISASIDRHAAAQRESETAK